MQALTPIDLPYADGKPAGRAIVRAAPEDFRVDEALGYPLAGQGQHLWLRIAKRLLNTEQVAGALARALGGGSARIGYAGLKDRRALTTQWFSVDLRGDAEPDWAGVLPVGSELIERRRHTRKLRRGAFARNHFTLVLREVVGDPGEFGSRLDRIRVRGVPNYFGPQRFGRNDANLSAAERLFAGTQRRCTRHQRGLYLSAARAFLFNRVLCERVRRGLWDMPVAGDCMMLDGSHSFFHLAAPDSEIVARSAAQDIHPTGPLWGAGPELTSGDALALERAALAPYTSCKDGLAGFGLEQQRRALRVVPRGLAWRSLGGDAMMLEFALPPGVFATSVLREVVFRA